jgi:hypothetical protein
VDSADTSARALQQASPIPSDRPFDQAGEHVTVDLTETASPNEGQLRGTKWLFVESLLISPLSAIAYLPEYLGWSQPIPGNQPVDELGA